MGPYARGPPGQLLACPCIKMALMTGKVGNLHEKKTLKQRIARNDGYFAHLHI